MPTIVIYNREGRTAAIKVAREYKLEYDYTPKGEHGNFALMDLDCEETAKAFGCSVDATDYHFLQKCFEYGVDGYNVDVY